MRLKNKLSVCRLMKKNYICALSQFQNGFTLVELLVVIAILGVLASSILVAIDPAAQLAKTRNSARRTSLKQLSDALERYKLAQGTYPPVANWCGQGYWAQFCVAPATPTNYIPGLTASGELKTLPQDPLVGQANSPCGTTWQSIGYYSDGNDYILLWCGAELPATWKSNDPLIDWRGLPWLYISTPAFAGI